MTYNVQYYFPQQEGRLEAEGRGAELFPIQIISNNPLK